MNNIGDFPMDVGSDVGCRGNISKNKKRLSYRCLKLRDSLRLLLADHDMRRPRKE